MSPRSRSTKLSEPDISVEPVPVVKRPRGRPRIHPLPVVPEAHKPEGRPSKYTPELAASICKDLELGNMRRAVAAAHGINKDTITEWINVYPEFSVQVRKSEATAEYRNVMRVQLGRTGWQAAAWWLERKFHEDWSRHDRIDLIFETRKEAEAVLKELGQPTDRESVDKLVAETERWAAQQG